MYGEPILCLVTKPGYTSKSIRNSSGIISDYTWRVTLDKEELKYGTLNFNITPSDATVKVNGVTVSNTSVPYTVPANTELSIEISKSGYTTYSNTLYVSSGESRTLEVDLSPATESEVVKIQEIFNSESERVDRYNIPYIGTTYNLKYLFNSENVTLDTDIRNSSVINNLDWLSLEKDTSSESYILSVFPNSSSEIRYASIEFRYIYNGAARVLIYNIRQKIIE